MRTIIAFLLVLMTSSAAANEITGVVADSSGKPLAGARVYVYTASPRMGRSAVCPSCYRDCGKQVTADANGAFRLQELDRTLLFDLLAFADGYESAFVKRVDPAAGPVTIALNAPAATDPDKLIAGVVLDPDGKPVVGASVIPHAYHFRQGFIWGQYPGIDRMSITNAKGEFALRIPDAGHKLDVRVMARSYATKIERAIASRQRREIRLTEGTAISGRVMRDGTPVAGVPVKAAQQDRRASEFVGFSEIATNEHGLFVLANMPPEQTYVVHVPMDSGLAVRPAVVTTGADGSSADAGTLAVVPGRRLGGTIVVPEGVTLPPDVQLAVSPDGTADPRDVTLRGDASFSVDGIPPGDVQILLRVPGFRVAPASTGFDPLREAVIVRGDADCTDIRLVLERR